MNNYSDFQKKVSELVWTQEETTSRNLVCWATRCYSNCHEDCGVPRIRFNPFDIRSCKAVRFISGKCNACKHSSREHSHRHYLWREVPDVHVKIDEGMKKRWNEAKEDKERKEAALEALRATSVNLTSALETGLTTLSELAAEYARLSLSGSFTAQVEKAIALYEQKLQGLQEKGVNAEQLKVVEACLDEMRSKQAVLITAKPKAKDLYGKAKTGLIGGVSKAWKATQSPILSRLGTAQSPT